MLWIFSKFGASVIPIEGLGEGLNFSKSKASVIPIEDLGEGWNISKSKASVIPKDGLREGWNFSKLGASVIPIDGRGEEGNFSKSRASVIPIEGLREGCFKQISSNGCRINVLIPLAAPSLVPVSIVVRIAKGRILMKAVCRWVSQVQGRRLCYARRQRYCRYTA